MGIVTLMSAKRGDGEGGVRGGPGYRACVPHALSRQGLGSGGMASSEGRMLSSRRADAGRRGRDGPLVGVKGLMEGLAGHKASQVGD